MNAKQRRKARRLLRFKIDEYIKRYGITKWDSGSPLLPKMIGYKGKEEKINATV